MQFRGFVFSFVDKRQRGNVIRWPIGIFRVSDRYFVNLPTWRIVDFKNEISFSDFTVLSI